MTQEDEIALIASAVGEAFAVMEFTDAPVTGPQVLARAINPSETDFTSEFQRQVTASYEKHAGEWRERTRRLSDARRELAQELDRVSGKLRRMAEEERGWGR